MGARPPGDRRALGRLGEELAAAHLRSRGLVIVARNVHLRHAELDLVALDGSTLCIVEVRLRSSDRFGSPEESLDARKLARLRRAAAQLLARGGLPPFRDVRFDLVAVDASCRPPRIRHVRDLFDSS
jgi:putative endonuclease